MSTTNGTHYKVIGTRPIRHDGTDKVVGRAVYGGDVRLSGMLYGQVLRSPHAHARIRSIDIAKAAALPGVRAVTTAADFPSTTDKRMDLGEEVVSLKYLRENILASHKVVYKGQAVAGVAAIDIHTAEEALALIEVEYEVLPAVVEVRQAMQEGAPLLHDTLTTKELGEDTGRQSNISSHLRHTLGDLAAGFAAAAVVVEREFRTATVHQGYIEPQNATAMWSPDGQLTVWTSTQGAFTARDQIAAVLDHPVSKIKVVPQEIGGGFGGKIPVYLEPVAALLSRKTGHPVKLVMTRADVFQGTGPTPGSYIKVKMGVDQSGRIVAGLADMAFEAGGFPGAEIGAAAMCVFSCYDIANVQVDAYDVVVNKPKSAPYRAPGAPQAAFAVEIVVDELAEKLGLDPVDFRLKNAAREGTRRADGMVFPRIGCVETLEAIKNHPNYQIPLKPNQGRGVAIGYWFNIGLRSSVSASVNEDGTVNLIEGSTDIGGSRASIAMQFAEVLGLAAEDVNPAVVDTNSIGHTDVTGGRRVTYATGWAAYEAAQDVKAQMILRAAKLWEVPADQVEFSEGSFLHKSDPGKRLTFKELAAKLDETGGPLTGKGNVQPNSGAGGSYAANIVDVEVDPETGKVQVLRFTIAQDAGKAIHPAYVEGQMQGGAVQGIGWALNEEYCYNERGEMANSSYLDYRIPTALDLPMIDTVIVEVPNPGHPFGVRGVGEAPIVSPMAAIANAIYGATGVRLNELPMRPDRILAATQAAG